MSRNKFSSKNIGPKQFFFFAMLAFMGVVALLNLTEGSRGIQPISYSTFIKNLESDNVKKVHVVGQRAYGAFKKTDKKFEVVLPKDNQNYQDLLQKHNVETSFGEFNPNISSPFSWVFIFMLLSLGVFVWLWTRKSKSSGSNNSFGSGIFNMGKSKAKMFLPSQVKLNFDDVAGATEAKEELADIIDFLKNPEKFKKMGAKLPRGILLVGEPGNGKTLLARAVAGEANCPFFMISGSDFVEVFVGVGAARIRDLFAQARKYAPCIVFIDEIDAIGRQRGHGLGGGNDEREQTLNQLLSEMDGFDSQGFPLIIIAATNIPDVLDKALLRPGRFDRRVTVPYPDAKAREEIFKIHSKKLKISDAVDIQKLAEDTAGFSGADLANLVNFAALSASKKNHDEIIPKDIEEAKNKAFKSQETQNAVGIKGSIKAKLFMPQQVKTTFADVAGIQEAKEEIIDVIDFLKTPQKFKALGARIPRGVLLVGEPGNGKTLLAKAVAGEANRPFFSVSGSDFIEIYVGVGASRVRELFGEARKHAPSIVFIDEIDSIGAQRSIRYGGSSEYDQTLNQLLAELDGFNTSESDVIIISATNRIDILDKALLRPGRFDRQVMVPYPDLISREKILEVHIKKIKKADDVDINKLARGTPGFSGADLANMVNEAAIYASKQEKTAVDMADFNEARDKIIMGKEMKSRVLSKEELNNVAYHEAGHALVNLLMPEVTEPLFKVTIIPRGMSLGSTHYLPEKERHITTKEQMLGKIMSSLGGRIAEEIQFKTLSTGAYGDFKSATEIARRMVCVYGMSEKLGVVIYENDNYSQTTAHMIDEEIKEILKTCYDKVKQLLVSNKDKLDKLANLLLEKETVQAEEIYDRLGLKPRVSA